ncbi:MAG: FMN-binding protein [Candidatus Cloacimonetes bacterium]|nr:FMN-binding protein [Candidatus Cloacimonadota bacterium]
MGKNKIPFTESRSYPVFFMILITVIFIGILATFHQITRQRIENHRILSYKKTVLSLFDLPFTNIEADYNDFIEENNQNGMDYLTARKENQIIGYGFNISGSGLWGSIHMIIAVTPDFQEIIKLDILDQNETPGLGGRITESWFKDQFSGKDFVEQGKIIPFKLVPEEDDIDLKEIRQITGASSSSKAVVKILYLELQNIADKLGIKYD